MAASASVACNFTANNPRGSVEYALQRKPTAGTWPASGIVEPVSGPGSILSQISRASGAVTATRAGYIVTTSADFFSTADRGWDIKFGASGPASVIASIQDPRHATVADQGTVAATAFTVSTDKVELTDLTVITGSWTYRALARVVVNGTVVNVSGFSNEIEVVVPPNSPANLAINVDLGGIVNLSTRGRMGPGDDALIVGAVAFGRPVQLLFRAVGPSLARFGLTAPVARPRIRLVHEGELVALNEGWGDDPALAAAAARVNAFALDAGSLDAALLTTLAPGAYTAVCEPVDGLAGTALVEAYLVN